MKARSEDGAARLMAQVVHQEQAKVTDAEWQIRCDLAALYRICDMYGWTDTINTHLSVRIPGEPNCFLINNYGDLFSEVTASSLVKVDIEGNILSAGGEFNPAGFIIHGGVYKARPDVNCVMHTHTRPGTGISVLKRGLRPISQDALSVYDELAYHEYGSLAAGAQEEGDALGATCQKGDSLILRNHGLLTVGATIQAALRRMYMLDRACEVEIIARSMGETPAPIEPEVVEDSARYMKVVRASPQFGMADWRAALRQLKGRGPDWRQ
ncbi:MULTISPECIES: class II aldolase/adducin family protein [Bradyrhizobium]|uniref:class II aldolase/adducin family protein n=1 Tax=Bradyrhizobium centrosematis TaxID=1300039 RepID=UPI0021684991|nr:class II aldolase/adducin family protein [Bradyrhizobium centrosematis]MCS3765632.1 ribulose-5-phosphate 4-epimerase/fuculose-1-phosphate aldolase [Bradyrhizobium centrosematis]MCS3778166.1 ribulose-5-phosphate 4-epimerase/fuculose-1-phosphate aldolase [Bradyrhizobium centrosematis]